MSQKIAWVELNSLWLLKTINFMPKSIYIHTASELKTWLDA